MEFKTISKERLFVKWIGMTGQTTLLHPQSTWTIYRTFRHFQKVSTTYKRLQGFSSTWRKPWLHYSTNWKSHEHSVTLRFVKWSFSWTPLIVFLRLQFGLWSWPTDSVKSLSAGVWDTCVTEIWKMHTIKHTSTNFVCSIHLRLAVISGIYSGAGTRSF